MAVGANSFALFMKQQRANEFAPTPDLQCRVEFIRLNRICEERGTDFQIVVQSVELFGLPPVVFTPLENAFRRPSP